MSSLKNQIERNNIILEHYQEMKDELEESIYQIGYNIDMKNDKVENLASQLIDSVVDSFIEQSILDVEKLGLELEEDGKTQTIAIPMEVNAEAAQEMLDKVQIHSDPSQVLFEALIKSSIEDPTQSNSDIRISDLINNISKTVGLSDKQQEHLNQKIDQGFRSQLGISLEEAKGQLTLTNNEKNTYAALLSVSHNITRMVALHESKLETLKELNETIDNLNQEQESLQDEYRSTASYKIRSTLQNISFKVLDSITNAVNSTVAFVQDIPNKISNANHDMEIFAEAKAQAFAKLSGKVISDASKAIENVCRNITYNFTKDHVYDVLLNYAEKDKQSSSNIRDALPAIYKVMGEEFTQNLYKDLNNIETEHNAIRSVEVAKERLAHNQNVIQHWENEAKINDSKASKMEKKQIKLGTKQYDQHELSEELKGRLKELQTEQDAAREHLKDLKNQLSELPKKGEKGYDKYLRNSIETKIINQGCVVANNEKIIRNMEIDVENLKAEQMKMVDNSHKLMSQQEKYENKAMQADKMVRAARDELYQNNQEVKRYESEKESALDIREKRHEDRKKVKQDYLDR